MFVENGYLTTETKADPFTLESLIAWLETQPSNTEYDWINCDACLCGQYVRAITGNDFPSGVTIYAHMFADHVEYGDVASERPWTFGAALDRARKALAAR
ncbi:hypothetical protein JQ633_00910 [Bradyrhizobium tropiciagri]|uniref:hypothetical protein n=1 Tax=Bradyrhizobium tropiciagri TaxID=312253 RepID=UPI001BAB4286|nr:hypothetical protein [Bradyrhizobium tropiciagri]MBR0868900.1 hypothetical protein [Bradyrhizobium tropiciagri]